MRAWPRRSFETALGCSTEEALAQRIAEAGHLARESLEGLTAEQLAIIADAALAQEHFFDRPQ
jgi:hypothetical protein